MVLTPAAKGREFQAGLWEAAFGDGVRGWESRPFRCSPSCLTLAQEQGLLNKQVRGQEILQEALPADRHILRATQ